MKLKDICEINPRMQKIDDSTEVSFVSMPSVSEDGKIDTTDIRRYSDVKKGYTSFKENDVLFAKITPCMENGKGAIARGLRNGYGCGSSEFHVLRSNDKAMPEWIYCLTSWQRFREKAEKHMTGSAGQRRVPKQYLENYEIRLPGLKVQAQQVETLMHLRSIIDRRITEVRSFDELIKARFVEMFGDPILNQKGFPVYRMDEIVEFQGGSQPDKKYFEYESTDDNIRLIQIRDYKTDNYITYIPKAMAKRFCTAEDIMIGRYGPPIFQILQGIEGAFNVALMKATPRQGNREYVRWFLKQDCLLHYLEGMSKRTAGQDGIQMDKLKTYPFPLAPKELQEQFATFVTQVDKSKAVVQKSLDESQMLFDSLMQKYFG